MRGKKRKKMYFNIAYKIPNGKWHVQRVDRLAAANLIFILKSMDRDFRVQSQSGEKCTEAQISEILSELPWWYWHGFC